MNMNNIKYITCLFFCSQALRFCAFMLKREAQENENLAYEQQAQQFFNSIESNMSTLLAQQPVEICSETAVAATSTETITEITTEEPSQYRVVLGTSTGDSQPMTLSLQVQKLFINFNLFIKIVWSSAGWG